MYNEIQDKVFEGLLSAAAYDVMCEEAEAYPTDEELAEAEAYYLQYYGAEDIATLCETVGVTETYFQNTIHFSVTYANVMDFLTENATFQGAK